jgi:hypothetical protein
MIYSSKKESDSKMENQKSKSGSKSDPKKSSSNEKIDVKLNKNAILNTNTNTNANTNTNTKEKKKDNNIIFILVEKNGSLKEVEIKESQICAEELSKKCKFKKVDGFIKRTQWSYSSKSGEDNSSGKIVIELWAKNDGIANYENKYEFPPPVDNDLYFGCCALVAKDTKNNYVNLRKEKWNKIYEYLFGGFESLVGNEDDDDDEEDELDSIPTSRKTRDGYLKDGFVVDGGVGGESDIEEDSDDSDDSNDDEDSDSDESSGNSNDGDEDGGDGADGGDGGDGEDDTYVKKKNKNILVKNKLSKNKPKGRNTKEEDDDNYNSGWNTDESSELSEEEYSYSK